MCSSDLETEQIKRESEQIERESEQIRKETEQIRSEIEQIEKETELLRQQNAKGRELLAYIHTLCCPDESSSTPAPPTATGSAPSSPS